MLSMSPGDWIALGSVCILAGGNVLMWRRDASDSRSKLRDDVTSEVLEKADVSTIHATLQMMASDLREQKTSFHMHEVECAKDKSAIRAEQKALLATQETINNRLSSIQQQITNLALNLAPGKGISLRTIRE